MNAHNAGMGTRAKHSTGAGTLPVAALAAAALVGPVNVASGQMAIIDSRMCIWGAGPAPAVVGSIEPFDHDLGFVATGSETVTFPVVEGLTNCCSGTPATTPDGVGNCCSTNLGPLNNLSGIVGPGGMFLVGVFTQEALPGSPPPTLNFNTLGINFTTIAPQLGQLFFIGNGRTGTNVLQSFQIPVGATRLTLGIADGNGFSGQPCCYQDNTGALTVTFEVEGAPCYPDCDASGVLTIDDFICFQTFFAIGDPYADCDASGNLSIDDFICFQTFFAIGC